MRKTNVNFHCHNLQSYFLFSLNFFLFEFSAEPPSVITAFNTSSSSIYVTWGWHNEDYESNYSISGYKLTYKEPSKTNEVFNFLCTLSSSAELTKLKVFTKYCLEIASFTNNSVSNRSHCLLVSTDEERE